MSNDNGKTKEDWKERSVELNDHATKARDTFGKGSYHSLENDVEDFKYADTAKDKALLGGKIAGKSLLNVGKFTFGKALPAMFEQASKKAKDLSK